MATTDSPSDSPRHPEGNYPCEYDDCSEVFDDEEQLDDHKRDAHQGKNEHCYMCDNTFATQRELREHYETHSASERRPSKPLAGTPCDDPEQLNRKLSYADQCCREECALDALKLMETYCSKYGIVPQGPIYTTRRNSLFQVVRDQLKLLRKPYQGTIHELRVDALKAPPQVVGELTTDWEKYKRDIKEQRRLPDYFMIYLMCQMLKRDIIIFTSEITNDQLHFIVTARPARARRPLMIGYLSNQMFVSLNPKDNSFDLQKCIAEAVALEDSKDLRDRIKNADTEFIDEYYYHGKLLAQFRKKIYQLGYEYRDLQEGCLFHIIRDQLRLREYPGRHNLKEMHSGVVEYLRGLDDFQDYEEFFHEIECNDDDMCDSNCPANYENFKQIPNSDIHTALVLFALAKVIGHDIDIIVVSKANKKAEVLKIKSNPKSQCANPLILVHMHALRCMSLIPPQGTHFFDEEAERYPCYVLWCSKVFNSEQDLADHKLQEHQNDCYMCDKRFDTRSLFNEHVNTHGESEQRPPEPVPGITCDYPETLTIKLVQAEQSWVELSQNEAVKRLEKYCTTYGLVLKCTVDGDPGRRFLDAVHDQLTFIGSRFQGSIKELRRKVLKVAKQLRKKHKMKEDDSDIHHLVICATAEFLKRDIVIIPSVSELTQSHFKVKSLTRGDEAKPLILGCIYDYAFVSLETRGSNLGSEKCAADADEITNPRELLEKIDEVDRAFYMEHNEHHLDVRLNHQSYQLGYDIGLTEESCLFHTIQEQLHLRRYPGRHQLSKMYLGVFEYLQRFPAFQDSGEFFDIIKCEGNECIALKKYKQIQQSDERTALLLFALAHTIGHDIHIVVASDWNDKAECVKIKSNPESECSNPLILGHFRALRFKSIMPPQATRMFQGPCLHHIKERKKKARNKPCTGYNVIKEHTCTFQNCSRMFKSKELITQHVRLTHSALNYACDVCDKRYGTLNQLQRHKKDIHSDEKYPCKHCGKLSATKGLRASHYIAVHAEYRFVCKYCRQKHKIRNQLRTHYEDAHTDEENARLMMEEKCTHLGFKFSSVKPGDKDNPLFEEVSYQLGVVALPEQISAVELRSRIIKFLRMQIDTTEEKDETDTQIRCLDKCIDRLKNGAKPDEVAILAIAMMLNVIIEIITTTPDEFKNGVKEITSTSGVTKVTYYGSKEPLATIRLANVFKLYYESLVPLHENIEIDPARDLMYCPYKGCNKTCTYKSCMQRHIKQEHIEQEHTEFHITCPQCNMELTSYKNYILHIIAHKGPYMCPKENCGKEYTHRQDLWNHIEVEHEDFRVACRYCRTEYRKQSYATTHIKKTHTVEERARLKLVIWLNESGWQVRFSESDDPDDSFFDAVSDQLNFKLNLPKQVAHDLRAEAADYLDDRLQTGSYMFQVDDDTVDIRDYEDDWNQYITDLRGEAWPNRTTYIVMANMLQVDICIYTSLCSMTYRGTEQGKDPRATLNIGHVYQQHYDSIQRAGEGEDDEENESTVEPPTKRFKGNETPGPSVKRPVLKMPPSHRKGKHVKDTFKCRYCKLSYSDETLKQRIVRKTSVLQDLQFICPLCNRTLERLDAVETHMRGHRSESTVESYSDVDSDFECQPPTQRSKGKETPEPTKPLPKRTSTNIKRPVLKLPRNPKYRTGGKHDTDDGSVTGRRTRKGKRLRVIFDSSASETDQTKDAGTGKDYYCAACNGRLLSVGEMTKDNHLQERSVGCDDCEERFHWRHMEDLIEFPNEDDPWYCPDCTLNRELGTKRIGKSVHIYSDDTDGESVIDKRTKKGKRPRVVNDTSASETDQAADAGADHEDADGTIYYCHKCKVELLEEENIDDKNVREEESVGCDECLEWFHWKCVRPNVNEPIPASGDEPWYCPECTSERERRTKQAQKRRKR